MSWEDFKNLKRDEFCPVNEMRKLETEFWNHAMVGAGHAMYTHRFLELARLVSHLVTPKNKRIDRNRLLKKNTEKRVRREYMGMTPKCMKNNLHHLLESPCQACFSCNHLGHLAKDYRVVEPSTKTRGSNSNQLVAIDGGQGRRNNSNWARGGASMLGVEEAHQDPNIMTGIESSNLGFSYEIEISSGQLLEIDKVIRGCKLEIEGYTLSIDLIPVGSGSFNVIIGIDWLSKHKDEIIFHEKVVSIPQQNGKTLRVIGEIPE
nr:hypothetical protein [Tanacetum cinerariifolium]